MCEREPRWTVRATIDRIALTFRTRRHWLGFYSIRYHGRLASCPDDTYLAAMTELINRGLVIVSSPPKAEFPVYILAALTYSAGRRRRAKGGRR